MSNPWHVYMEATVAHERSRSRAYQLVARAIKRGELPHVSTQYCIDCGRFAECYDHRDYSRPLAVDPVCRRCNTRRGRTFRDHEITALYRAGTAYISQSGKRLGRGTILQ